MSTVCIMIFLMINYMIIIVRKFQRYKDTTVICKLFVLENFLRVKKCQFAII